MAEGRPARGILDTSVVIDLDRLDPSILPIEVAVSAITMAELAAGPHATSDPTKRALRQDRLQRAEAAFDPLPFDSESSRAYGRIYAAVVAAGRTARGGRAVDLFIAATAPAPLACRSTPGTPLTSARWKGSSRSSASDIARGWDPLSGEGARRETVSRRGRARRGTSR